VGIQAAPTALAAPASILNPDTTRAVLDASRSYDSQGGSIRAYQWQFLSVEDGHGRPPSGPTISNAKSAVTNVSGLIAGYTYQFQVVVEDNDFARDTTVQNITIQPWKASYSMQASATTLSLYSEFFVSVSILDSVGMPVSVEHEPCSIQLLYAEGTARNGLHFVAYNQTLSFARNQSVAVSSPVLALVADDEASSSNSSTSALDFSVSISGGTEAFPFIVSLSNSNYASVRINSEPVRNTNHDIVSFTYTTNLTKDALIPHLSRAKRGISDLLGVPRNNVLFGRIGQTIPQERRESSVQGAILPVKILTRQGDGHGLMQNLSTAEIASAIDAIMPQGPTLGNMGQVSVSSSLQQSR
jgi:hypothetical protein